MVPHPSVQLQDQLFPLAVPRAARTASPTVRRPEAHKQRFHRQRELQTRLQDRQPGTQKAFIQYFFRLRSSRALFLTRRAAPRRAGPRGAASRGRRGPGPGPGRPPAIASHPPHSGRATAATAAHARAHASAAHAAGHVRAGPRRFLWQRRPLGALGGAERALGYHGGGGDISPTLFY